jgi:hypothetical protein
MIEEEKSNRGSASTWVFMFKSKWWPS